MWLIIWGLSNSSWKLMKSNYSPKAWIPPWSPSKNSSRHGPTLALATLSKMAVSVCWLPQEPPQSFASPPSLYIVTFASFPLSLNKDYFPWVCFLGMYLFLFSSSLDNMICFLVVILAKVLPPDVLPMEEPCQGFTPCGAFWASGALRFLSHLWLDIHWQRTHGHEEGVPTPPLCCS